VRQTGSIVLVAALFPLGSVAAGESVRIETNMGNIDVALYDATPLTRDNFLLYTDEGAYEMSIMHRSAPGFVIQGGGYRQAPPDSGFLLEPVPTHEPVPNEASLDRSNVTGTIAMAKLEGDPDSATSQWFINLSDNGGEPPDGLDYQNGGFTTFGDVVCGMDVAYAVAALPRWNFGGALGSTPMRESYDGAGTPEIEEFVLVCRVFRLMPGDADCDGDVDLDDLFTVRNNFSSPGTWDDGNFDHDDVVDLDDLFTVRNNFGFGTSAPVPEPASAALMLSGIGLMARRR